jgi:ketosteroid isomerase-like protein
MHPHEQMARREIELLNAGDDAGLAELYAEDVVLHYPGRNPLAGTYRDLDAFVTKLQGLLGSGTVTRELHDAFGTDDHAVQLLRVRASTGDRSHAWNAAVVYHVRDGRFSEVWIHVQDQYALDEFLSSLPG